MIADAVGVTDDIVEMDVGVLVEDFDVVIDCCCCDCSESLLLLLMMMLE